MGILYTNSDPFESFGQRPFFSAKRFIDGSHGDVLVTGGLFTVTNVATTTVAQANLGGRPCFQFTNTGSTATDGVQFQGVAASILLAAGKSVRLLGGFYGDTTTQEFSFGLAAADTSIIASASTDFAKMEKLTGTLYPSIKTRKASGTAEAGSNLLPVAASTWYDFCMDITPDPITSGKGIVTVSVNNAGIAAGGQLGSFYSISVAAAMPNTVAMSPFMAWRAGSAANVNGAVSHFGWCVQG